MKLIFRMLAFVCVLAVLIGGYFWLDRKVRRDMAFNYEFKRMHVAPGTLRSISGGASTSSSAHAPTVCFTIDSFSDIPHDLQAEYAAAERSRTAKDGPRCIQVSDQRSSSIAGMPGESIQVYYLLYGHGVIDVESVAVRGQELKAM
jgi:hypothetical protein